MTPSEIEPATSRLVARCLNQLSPIRFLKFYLSFYNFYEQPDDFLLEDEHYCYIINIEFFFTVTAQLTS